MKQYGWGYLWLRYLLCPDISCRIRLAGLCIAFILLGYGFGYMTRYLYG